MIKFLGNHLKEIEAVHVLAQESSYFQIREDIIAFVKKIPDASLLTALVPQEYEFLCNTSFFVQKKSISCREWHVDAISSCKESGMIIASYPHPTYIIESELGLDAFQLHRNFSNCESNKEELVDGIIKNNKAKVIVPNKGDVYLLSSDVIHKTNPLATDNHLCLRIHIRKKNAA